MINLDNITYDLASIKTNHKLSKRETKVLDFAVSLLELHVNMTASVESEAQDVEYKPRACHVCGRPCEKVFTDHSGQVQFVSKPKFFCSSSCFYDYTKRKGNYEDAT